MIKSENEEKAAELIQMQRKVVYRHMGKESLQSEQNRELVSDALKASAAMIVFLLHGRLFLPMADQMTESLRWISYFPAWGGVWIFLVLSGYGIGTGFFQGKYSLTDQDGRVRVTKIFRFYIERLLKTAPFYYLYCLLFEIFSGQFFFWQNPGVCFRMLTFTFNGNGGINGLGHLWYLSMAVQLYVCMPLLYLCIQFLCKTDRACVLSYVVVLILGMVLRVVLYCAGKDWYTQIYTNFLVNLDLTAAGMLTAKVKSAEFTGVNRKAKEKIKAAGVAVFAGLILYNCHIYAANTQNGYFIYRCILPSAYICNCTLLLCVAGCGEKGTQTGMARKAKKIATNAVRQFSRSSFVFYVFHISVLDYLGKTLALAEWFLDMHPDSQYMLFFAAAFGILLPLSDLFTRWNVDLVRCLRKMAGFDTGGS